MRGACSGCPAFNYLEGGEEDVKSEYVCKTTELRWNEIQKVMGGGPASDWKPVSLTLRRATTVKEPAR